MPSGSSRSWAATNTSGPTGVSSNAVYSVVSAPDEDFYTDDMQQAPRLRAINLLYWFLPDRAWAGVEYLYGRREVFGGEVGDANRLQFAVRFNFPS